MDEQLRRLSGWYPPWEPGELSLADAWARSPDGRWMVAATVQGGATRRVIVRALAASVRAALPSDAVPTWSPVLDAADRYGRGEGEPTDLAAAVPGPPRKGQPAPTTPAVGELVATLRGVEATLPEGLAGIAGVVTVTVLRALHPSTAYPDLATVGAQAVEQLAVHRGLRSRAESRSSTETMLDEQAASPGPKAAVLTARATVPPTDSQAWDESAARAFAHTLRETADAVREHVPCPF